MKVAELRTALQTINLQSPDARAELDVLQSVLKGLDELTVAELCEKITSGKIKKKATAKASKAAPGISPDRYLAELHATKDDNTAFEAVVARIKNDRMIKASDAQTLAEKFTGQPKKYPSKPKALKAILDRQIADKRSEARGSQISGIF